MPLTLYRLHTSACTGKYKRTDRAGKDCRCMIHVEGKLGSGFVRSSAKTRAWTKAAALVKAAEARGSWDEPVPDEPTIEVTWTQGKPLSQAVAEFLADAADEKGRNLASPTLTKYKTLLTRLVEFGERSGLTTLPQMDFRTLTAFKREWPTGPLATGQNITRLRTFFEWCQLHDWIRVNPAAKLEPPKGDVVERLPYTKVEMETILQMCRSIKLNCQQPITNDELETFVLLMRYTGLAISDAALLETSEIKGDEIRLYRNKTRRNAKRRLVVVPMPDFLLKRIKLLPLQNGRYYFAHGTPTIAAQVEAWRKRLAMVFQAAKITHDPGSHRFRHTFATDLLERGYSIELVSKWLGHESIKVTQQHYSHWVESRIQAASDQLRKLYTADYAPDA